MKVVTFLFFFLFLLAQGANASEYLGVISTKPDFDKPGSSTPDSSIDITEKTNTKNNPFGAPFIFMKKNALADPSRLVLGVKSFQNGSLVKDEIGRIFIIQNGYKKHILNFKELAKFRGLPILRSTIQELSAYPTRSGLDGDLIRVSGKKDVFVIAKGKKAKVRNIEELRTKYRKKVIYNISPEEWLKY
jgi:hypothetical protein